MAGASFRAWGAQRLLPATRSPRATSISAEAPSKGATGNGEDGGQGKMTKKDCGLRVLKVIKDGPGKGLIDIKDLQKIGIRAIVIPIPRARRSRVKDKRAEALRLFREADTTQAKKQMVAAWNLVNGGQEVSLASLYRWNRSIRMNMAARMGDGEVLDRERASAELPGNELAYIAK